MTEILYKVAEAAEWAAAKAAGSYKGAPIDLADGFIHFSTAEQLAETLARHFQGQTNLVLLGVSVDALEGAGLGDALKWEPSRGGALFPHLYAELPVAVVQTEAPLETGTDGGHVLPPVAQ